LVPAAIFAAALLLRLALLLAHPRPLVSDEIDYDRLGWTLATTGTYSAGGHPTAYRPIGYPAVIAAVYSIAGHAPAVVKGFQAVLDSGTALLLFALFSRRDRKAGLFAGWIWALLPAAALFSTQLFSETLAVFGVVLAASLLDRNDASPGAIWIAGPLLGGLMLVKPQVMSLFAIAAPFTLQGRGRARRGLLLLLAVLPLAVWTGRNAVVLGSPALTTSVGTNLLIGNNPRATGGYGPVDPHVTLPPSDDEVRHDAAAERAAIAYMVGHPLHVARNAVRKALLLATSEGELVVGRFASGAADPSTRYRDKYRSVPVWLHLLMSFPTALVLVVGVLGLATRPPDLVRRLFYALLAAVLLSSIVFFSGSRFRFPLMPFLSGFAAEFLAAPRRRWGLLRGRRLLLAAIPLAGFGVAWIGEMVSLGVFG
jgi:predicted membrane protein